VTAGKLVGWLPVLVLAATARADRLPAPPPFDTDPTVRAMKDELQRSVDKLELASFGKPYLLAYALNETRQTTITASFGALVTSDVEPSRVVAIDLHVGDYALDNTNFGAGDRERIVTLPIEDDYDAVRRSLWLATDHAYKHAVETLEHKRAVLKAEAKNSDDVGSYSKEPPSHIVDDHPLAAVDRARLEALAKKLSAVFRANPDVHTGKVTVHAFTARQVFVSSEGSSSVQSGSAVRITVDCDAQADDGMPIHDWLTFYAETVDQLPPEAELLAQVDKLSKRVSALRVAPVVDDYAGPVVFDDVAAGQILHTLFVSDLAGTPAVKSDSPGSHDDPNPLASKVGKRVLPLGTSVVDDPTIKRLGSVALAGENRFDDEGVPAQKVSLVDNGVFQRFLMSRVPRKGFEHSNGHGVGTASAPRAHPLNVVLASTRGVSDPELRRRAFAAAKDQGLAYVLYVDRLVTVGGEYLPHPGIMRRVYLDGHEQLVRGGTFGELPMRALKDLLGIGNAPTVYTVSGTSIASPPFAFRDIDVKKPTATHRKPPITPRPR
jgi:hypothetical protein